MTLSIEPHYYLRCPASHETRHIDADYPLRCQEWLLEDRLLVSLTSPTDRGTLCRCAEPLPEASSTTHYRQDEIQHRFDGQNLTTIVRFSYPVIRCSECDGLRAIGTEFETCWQPLARIPWR